MLLSGGRRAVVTVLTCVVHFVTAVDGFGTAILIPDIRAEFGLSIVGAQWVQTSFALTLCGGLLLGGRLCDHWGGMVVLRLGLACFAVSAVGAAFVDSPAGLFAWRAVQGGGAAAAIPAGLAVLADLHPAGPGRDRAMGVLGGMATAGMSTGLVAGGFAAGTIGWRLYFLGCGIAAAVPLVVLLLIRDRRSTRRGTVTVDWLSAAAVSAGAAALVYGLTRVAEGHGLFSAAGAAAAGLGLVSLAVRRSRGRVEPLIDIAALRVPSLLSAVLGVALVSAAFTAVVFVLPLVLRETLRLGGAPAALLLLTVTVSSSAVSAAAGRLARWPPVLVARSGFGLGTVGLGWAAAVIALHGRVGYLVPGLLAVGLGLAASFTVLTQRLFADVDASRRGGVAGLFETSQHLAGGALGVAGYAVVLQVGGFAGAWIALCVAAAACAAGTAVVGNLGPTTAGRSDPPKPSRDTPRSQTESIPVQGEFT